MEIDALGVAVGFLEMESERILRLRQAYLSKKRALSIERGRKTQLKLKGYYK